LLTISNKVTIPSCEYEFKNIRSQGAGGQNVNKVSTAAHLFFDVFASSLPDYYKSKLRDFKDKRINKSGVIVIKAQRFRSQEKNREDALKRLKELIVKATLKQKKRVPTKPSRSSKRKRLDEKSKRGETKGLRGRVFRQD